MRRPLRAVRPLAGIRRDNRGATAVEYGLVIALIVLVMLVALQSLADKTTGMWGYISAEVTKER